MAELNVHLAQMIVHRGVVNDFIGDPQTFFRVVLTGFVCHGNGSFHAPAKAERLCQSNIQPTVAEFVVVFADGADQATLIGLLKAFGHFFGTPEASPVVAL